MMCGGKGPAKPANAEVQDLIEKVKDQVLSKTNQSLDSYEAVSFSTQVVAGTNYFIKVQIGDARYIHIRIFRPLPPNQDNLQVHGIQENKSEDDELEYF